MTIYLLLIDDDELVREPLAEYLQWAGYVVYAASGGLEALELAERHHIDIVVSDFKMPDMDGYTLCVELHRLYNVPALLMSGFHDDYDEQQKAAAGIYDFIRKPFLPHELASRIRTVLAQFRSQP